MPRGPETSATAPRPSAALGSRRGQRSQLAPRGPPAAANRPRAARAAPGRGRVELRVLRQDRVLEGAQLGARLDADLLDERAPGAAVGLERVRLAAAAVQREHQLRAQVLAQRLLGDGGLQLETRSAWRPSASSASTCASNATQRRSSSRAISA